MNKKKDSKKPKAEKKKSKIILLLCLIIGIPLIIIILFFTIFMIDSFHLFPNTISILQQEKIYYQYKFLDNNNNIIPYNNFRKKITVTYNNIPIKIINTLLAVEDKNFFKHHGIDIIATIKGIFLLPIYMVYGKRPMGASTITQQFIRTIFLDMRYSYLRKIREIMLSFRIERQLNKKTILTFYLNNVYFGRGTYGIQAAAQDLFRKDLKNLNNEEIALLVGIIQNPSLSMDHNYNKALERRNTVLNIMYQNKIINYDEYLDALESSINYRKTNSSETFVHGQHFIQQSLLFVNNILKKNHSQIQLKNKIDNFDNIINMKNINEKIIVKTTLNSKIQKIAEKVLRNKIENITDRISDWHGTIGNIPEATLKKMSYREKMDFLLRYSKNKQYRKNLSIGLILSKKKNICLLDTGEKIELSKSPAGYNDKLYKGDIILVLKNKDKSYFPYQIPSIQGSIIILDGEGRILSLVGSNSYNESSLDRSLINMQLGSTMKVFVLLFLLQNGYEPNIMVNDIPVEIKQKSADDWIPRNWDNKFLGAMTLRDSMIFSRNCAIVKLIMEEPQLYKKFVIFCKKNLGSKDVFPSYILGSNEMSLLSMGEKFIPLCNGGYKKKLKFIDNILLLENNEVIFKQNLEKGIKIYKKDILFQTYKVFSNNRKKGLARSLQIPFHGACKSGTTNNHTRTVFVFYSKNFVIICSLATDNNENIKIYAVKGPGVIIKEILNELHKERLVEFQPLNKPKNIDVVLINKNTGLAIQEDTETKIDNIANNIDGKVNSFPKINNNIIKEYLRKKK